MAAMSCRGVPSPALRLFSFSHLRIALEFHLIIGYRSILRHKETHGSKGREGSEIQWRAWSVVDSESNSRSWQDGRATCSHSINKGMKTWQQSRMGLLDLDPRPQIRTLDHRFGPWTLSGHRLCYIPSPVLNGVLSAAWKHLRDLTPPMSKVRQGKERKGKVKFGKGREGKVNKVGYGKASYGSIR